MECPVCLELLYEKDGVTVNCCGHGFHSQCYTRAIQMNASCPLCRAKHEVDVVIQVEPEPAAEPIGCRPCLALFQLVVFAIGIVNIVVFTRPIKC